MCDGVSWTSVFNGDLVPFNCTVVSQLFNASGPRGYMAE